MCEAPESNPSESRKASKSVRWTSDHELLDVMEIATLQNVQENNVNHHPLAQTKTDESRMIENHVSYDDSLPLIADLMDKSSAVENYFASESDNIGERGKPTVDENERQVALQELVTHLEDTAALLKQYLAPPPADFVDHLSQSDKTNFVLKYQIILVLLSQTLSIGLLTLFDNLEQRASYVILGKLLGTTFQVLNTIIVLFATVVLSRQMLRYKVVGSFLAQTYVATVITFAGLYFIIYRFNNNSWEFGSVDKMEDSLAVEQFVKMIYLSVSAATLCGAANIQPRSWYTVMLLCFQSLINFVYFASILAQTIGNYNTYTVQVRRSTSMSALGTRKHRS